MKSIETDSCSMMNKQTKPMVQMLTEDRMKKNNELEMSPTDVCREKDLLGIEDEVLHCRKEIRL